jgi:uncharacterized Tic20 family protein
MKTALEQLNDNRKQQQARYRMAAILLALSALISIVFLAFAFYQKSETEWWKDKAQRLEQQTKQLQEELEVCRMGEG